MASLSVKWGFLILGHTMKTGKTPRERQVSARLCKLGCEVAAGVGGGGLDETSL